MQQFEHVFFQLEEARRYIADGRLPHLRVALLLLDNAAELQMDRRIQENWQHDTFYEDVRESRPKCPESEKPIDSPCFPIPEGWYPAHFYPSPDIWREAHQRWIERRESLPLREKRKIERYFDNKIKYLEERGYLDADLATSLRYLHTYRNETYHRAHVRPETIQTAVVVLLEVNCQMMLSLHSHSISMSSRVILDEIRSKVLSSDDHVATLLKTHLQSRLVDLDNTLTFIGGGALDQGSALKESEYFADLRCSSGKWSNSALERFQPRLDFQVIRKLVSHAEEIGTAPSRLEAFRRYSILEKELEPIEECVNDFADAIDMAIEAEAEGLKH